MIPAFVCIDLETTGLNPKTDKIIEIGAVKMLEGRETGTFQTLIRPGRTLDKRVEELTGLTNEMLKEAPLLPEVLPSLLTFLEDVPLVGHRILFDYSFLKKACVDQKISFEKQGIDTLKLARKFCTDLEHKNLPFLCEQFQITYKPHRALEDARATVQLYEKLWERYYTQEEKLFLPSPLFYKVKKDTPATKLQKERLYQLVKLHNIVLRQEIELLTKSEASRLTDQIYTQYGRL